MKTLIRILLLLCAATSALVLAGCGTAATIKYSQLANCWQYNTDSSTGTAGNSALFMLYRINSIEATSGIFYFDPDRLFVDDPSVTIGGAGGVNSLISNKVAKKTVPSVSKATALGKFFLQVPLSGPLNTHKHTIKLLQYKKPSAAHTITLVKEGPQTPDYLEPCTAPTVNGYSLTYP